MRKAIGSAFSRHRPSWPSTRNLYRVPAPTFGHEQLPDPGAAQRPHRVRPAGPAVEVAGDPHALRGRAPTPRSWCRRPCRTGCRSCGRARPSTSHSRSWRPSPIRCRSISPRVGSQRYGSSTCVDAVAVAHGQPVVGGRAGHHPGEQAGVVHPDQGDLGPVLRGPRAPRRRAGAGSGSLCRPGAGARRAPSAGRGGRRRAAGRSCPGRAGRDRPPLARPSGVLGGLLRPDVLRHFRRRRRVLLGRDICRRSRSGVPAAAGSLGVPAAAWSRLAVPPAAGSRSAVPPAAGSRSAVTPAAWSRSAVPPPPGLARPCRPRPGPARP